jgi:rRNA maturation endonuclease Nob1
VEVDETQPPEEWSAEQRRELRLALEARRHRQIRGGQIIAGTLVVIVATGVLLRLAPEWWVPAVGIVALAGLVFRLANWKCPGCGERLPTRGPGKACPGCGLPLE